MCVRVQDSTSVQVNPLAETRDGQLVAADAKLGFDDNAHFRQKELFDQRDESQEDPRCGLSASQRDKKCQTGSLGCPINVTAVSHCKLR